MALNHISTATLKADRQVAKLAIAKAKREGRTVADDGTITGSINTTATSYRTRNVLDITELPTVYSTATNNTNLVVDNPNTGGLVYGRPWTT
jgi:predicted RNA methylase